MPTGLDTLLSSIRECETHDAVKIRLRLSSTRTGRKTVC